MKKLILTILFSAVFAVTGFGQTKTADCLPYNSVIPAELRHGSSRFCPWIDPESGWLDISLTSVVASQAQQVNSFQLGNFIFNIPPANPLVTVQSPARSGTMALREDIVAGPAVLMQTGKITLTNGAGSAVLTGFTMIPDCVVSDPSGNSVRYANTLTALSVSGVGPSVVFLCR